MKTISIFIVLSLLIIISFGSFAVSHQEHNSQAGVCVIGALLQNQDCSLMSGSLEFAVFHLDALKQLSTAVFSGPGFFLLSVLLLAFVISRNSLKGIFSNPDITLFTLPFYLYKNKTEPLSKSRLNLVSWLALLIHSPTFSSN